MRRMRSRLTALVTMVALVALMAQGLPVSAMVTDTAGSGPPLKSAVVKTQSTPNGIRVKVLDLPAAVTSFDVYRSTVRGAVGAKLNTKPVVGKAYLDTSAKAGVTYFYTVKVASRDAKAANSRFVAPGTFAQTVAVSLKSRPVKHAARAASAQAKPSAHSAAKTLSATPAKALAFKSSPVPYSKISAMSVTIGASGPTTLTANTTWTTAMSPIFVRNDLVVPVGKTLTINPGVKVYFDTKMSGRGAAGTKMNPSVKVDLIVHGKLVAKGSATSPVRLTSIQSQSSSAPPLPNVGDWGYVFTDSRAASEITYARVEFGAGAWSLDTARPYITNSVFLGTGVEEAIAFDHPKTDTVTPRVRVVGNSISSPSEAIMVSAEADALHEGAMTVDPYIAYNGIQVSSGYGVHLIVDNTNPAYGTGDCIVRGSLVGNKLKSSSSATVRLEADSRGARTAGVYTAFSGNVMQTNDDDTVYAYAEAHNYGKAEVKPTFSADQLNAYNSAFTGMSFSDEDTSVGGAVLVQPKFTNCTLTSNGDDAVYLDAESANKGSASTSGTFIGGSIETASDNGVYANAESKHGSASSSPAFTNVYGGGHDSSEFLYLEAYADDTGLAKTNPRWTGGKMVNLDDTAVYLNADSRTGSAEAKPYFANTSVWSYTECFDVNANGSSGGTGSGTANVSGTVINTKLVIADNDDSTPIYYGEANADGTGAAIASPVLNKANVMAYGGDGLELYATSHDGAAIVSPSILNGSVIDAYNSGVYGKAQATGKGAATGSPVLNKATVKSHDDAGVYVEVYAADGLATLAPSILNGSVVQSDDYGVYGYVQRRPVATPTLWGSITASGKVDHSTIKGAGSDAYYLEAYNYGRGNAYVAPTVYSSRIENNHDDGAVYLNAWKDSGKDGLASVTPVMDHSYLLGADSYCVEPEATGPGVVGAGKTSSAVVAGTYKYCTFDNPYYDAISGSATNQGGSAEMRPYIQDCTGMTSDDNTFDLTATGGGTASHKVVCSPTVIRGDYSISANGFYFKATNENSGGAPTPVTCAPVIKDTKIYATWDQAIETYARSDTAGGAVNNAYIYNTLSKSYDGIYNHVDANSTGSALNTAKVLGISTAKRAVLESFDDNGVTNGARSSGGYASNSSQVKYLKIDSYGDAINIGSDGSGPVGATCSPLVYGNAVGTKWTADTAGVNVHASGANVISSPNVSANSIGSVFGDGVDIAMSGSSTNKLTPTVSSNSIGGANGVGGFGIMVTSSTGLKAGSKATITKNVITKSGGNGIRLIGIDWALVQQNKIDFPGWTNTSPSEIDVAGIMWSGADTSTATAALVKGNMVKNARTGVAYANGWPVTQYNSFGDTSGNYNRPFNLFTDKMTTAPSAKLNARYNWWAVTSSSGIASTIEHPLVIDTTSNVVDYSGALMSAAPKLTGLTLTEYATSLKFKLTFDRPMDKSITTLKFGKTSPYNKYKAVGTWNSAGTVWTGKFSPRSALTVGAKYYFSGARDLPGTTMVSTTKYFKP